MRDDTSTGSDAPDEGALLAAYLDGDTDEVTTARIERRLASDDALAARLDSLAETRARLQRLDEVVVPADVRARLRGRLDAERGASGGADGRHVHPGRATHGAEDPGVTTGIRRARRWSVRATPVLAAAAAIVLVAVLGTAALLGQLGMGGTDESAGAEVSLDAQGGAEAGEPQAAAPDDEAADRAAGGGAGAMAAESAASESARGSDGARGDQQAAAKVDGDDDIAARAERLRDDPPTNLVTRERRLRERAGLPTTRLCVRELRAATVDLVDEDGRVALAVMVRGASPQIVLLDPRTCAAVRTIPTQR